MNKKLWIGFVAVFVVSFLLDILVNNFIMMKEYMETAQLWRPQAEMKTGVILVVELSFAFFFTFIFSKGYEGKGAVEGLRYGLYVGLMMNVTGAYMTYATMPVPYMLALKWFLFGTVQCMIYGAVLGLIYGKDATVSSPEPRKMETMA
jgi:hypothetical protein